MANTDKTITDNLVRHDFFHQNLRLSYLDNGVVSNEMPVIMLHGFTTSAQTNWQTTGWIQQLTQADRRVIALDARGHGDSDKPYDSNYYPSNVMITDSLCLMEQLGIAQADFIGYSMGARMAAFATINHPKKVGKVVFGGMGGNFKKGMSNSQLIADALLADNLKQVSDRYARRFRRLAELGGNDLTALAHCILSSRQKLDTDKLKKIKAKSLILLGYKDEIAGNPYELQNDIANGQVTVIDGCNHFNALSNVTFRQSAIAFILSG